MLLLVPIVFAALMIAYAGFWRIHQSLRRADSWEEMAARLQPNDWTCASGIWATYRNAGVLIQLADYAAENGNSHVLPEEVLQSLRADAFQIRIRALRALLRRVFAIPQSEDEISSAS